MKMMKNKILLGFVTSIICISLLLLLFDNSNYNKESEDISESVSLFINEDLYMAKDSTPKYTNEDKDISIEANDYDRTMQPNDTEFVEADYYEYDYCNNDNSDYNDNYDDSYGYEELSEDVIEETEYLNDEISIKEVIPFNMSNHNIAYIWVGDSRFVGMDMVVHVESTPDNFLMAQSGSGYNYLSGEAYTNIKAFKENHPQYDEIVIVANHGVNDLGNASSYVQFYNTLLEEGYKLILISVNPTKAQDPITVDMNSMIEDFNSKIKEVNAPYLDTYNCMRETDFDTPDGLHYGDTSYSNLYNYITNYISSGEWCSYYIE